MNEFILTYIIPNIRKMWDNKYQAYRSVLVIFLSIGLSLLINKAWPDMAQPEQSGDSILYENSVVADIDAALLNCGYNSFITWIRFEQKNDEYRIIFKDVRGFIQKYNKPISVKHENPLYLEPQYLDNNTKEFIKKRAELSVEHITEDEAKFLGLSALLDIFKRQNLNIKKIKFVVIRDDKDIIWVYTLAFLNDTLFDTLLGESDLLKLAWNEKRRINAKRALTNYIQYISK